MTEHAANTLAAAETLCVYFAAVLGVARFNRRFAREALAVFIAVPLLSLVYPYDFRVTEANVLMKILQYQDPALFHADLTMQSTQAVGGYNFFSRLFSIIPYGAIPQVFYFSWLACLGAIGWFFRRVFENHFGSKRGLLLAYAALIVLGLTFKWQRYGGFILGDNDLAYNWFRHQSLAWALCLWALDAYFGRRWVAFGILTGMVINVHINTGQHLLILVAADWVLFNRAETRRVLAGLGLAAVVSLVTIAPVVWHEVLHAPPSRVEHGFTLVAGYFRHPFHFIPSSWSPTLYLQYGVFLVLGFACWLLKRPKTRVDFRLLGMVAVSLVGLAAGYVFVEIFPVDFVTRTQFARMTIFTKVILLVYILSAAERLAARRPVEIFAKYGRELVAAAVVLAFLATVTMRHYVIDPPRTPLEQFFLEKTRPNATVMLPPAFGFDHFGERTRRSAAVNMKVFPFARPWFLEYYERLMALGGMPAVYDREAIRKVSLVALIRNYNRLSEETLLALCRRWGCGYIVRDRRAAPLSRAEQVFEDDRYAVFEVRQAVGFDDHPSR
ncbi:hypothetical protein LLG95_08110 [bacterium]|nr:hypothetical protein [bacterium]